jgi:hypothetical protein
MYPCYCYFGRYVLYSGNTLGIRRQVTNIPRAIVDEARQLQSHACRDL